MTWPEVVSGAILALAVLTFFMGRWPWEGAIVIHKRCDCKRKKRNEED